MKSEEKVQTMPSQMLQLGGTLRRNAWSVGLLTVMMALTAIVVITLIRDQYRATTTILVDPQRIPDRYVTSTVPADPTERLNTISQQVMSATCLGEIIDQMHLYPEMRRMAREDIIENMRRHITLQVKQSSGQGLGSFTITYEGSSPDVVARVANQLAASFIDWNLKNRELRAEGTTQFLATQLEEAKQNLQGQEQKLRDFKMSHVGQMPDQMTANLQTLSRLQVALQANTDSLNRLEQEKQLLMRVPEPQQASTGQLGERARLVLEQRQLNTELWELKKKYTDSHPDVQAAVARLARVQSQLQALPPETPEAVAAESTGTAVRLELIDKEKHRLLKEQQSIQAQFQSYQAKVDAVPLREQQLTDLTRDYEISKEHYSSLLEKSLSAGMATELEKRQEGERFTVLDLAKAPERPFKPNRLLLMAGSLAGSFIGAMFVVTVKERWSSTINGEEELRALLPGSAVFLASIPRIETQRDQKLRIRLRAAAVAVSLMACAAVAFLVWKVHPIF